MDAISWTLIVYLLTPTMMETVKTESYPTVQECMAAGEKIILSNKKHINSYMTTCSAVYPKDETMEEVDGK